MNLDFRGDIPLRAARSFAEAVQAHHACTQCRYAQLFAVQPRALCVHPSAALRHHVLFAGQPVCADFIMHIGADIRLAAYQPPAVEAEMPAYAA